MKFEGKIFRQFCFCSYSFFFADNGLKLANIIERISNKIGGLILELFKRYDEAKNCEIFEHCFASKTKKLKIEEKCSFNFLKALRLKHLHLF